MVLHPDDAIDPSAMCSVLTMPSYTVQAAPLGEVTPSEYAYEIRIRNYYLL